MNKKIMLLAIFVVSLLAVSAVSAADNITDDTVSMDENGNKKLDGSNYLASSNSADENEVQSSVESGEVLSASSYNDDVTQKTENVSRLSTHVKVSSFKAKIGSKHSIRAYISDDSGSRDDVSGIAKFKINGKTYNAKVKGGLATVDVKLPLKVKTLKCSVKFLGNSHYLGSSAKFKIKLTKSHVSILKKNRSVKIGKYTIKLTPKQYKSLVKAFKKGKSKSIKVKTNYKYNVRKPYYKEVKHYKTLKTVKTIYSIYLSEFKKMRRHGWQKVSEYTFTKKNSQYSQGIGLSAYTYSVSKWVKPSYHLAYKTKHYPVNAKITVKKSSTLPKIKIYSHGKTLKSRDLAIK